MTCLRGGARGKCLPSFPGFPLTLHLHASVGKFIEDSSDPEFQPDKHLSISRLSEWGKNSLPMCGPFPSHSPPPMKSKQPRRENCLFEKAISKCFHHSNALLKILSTVVITWTMLSISVVCRKSSFGQKSRTSCTYLKKKINQFPCHWIYFHPDNTFIKGEIAVNNSKPNRNQLCTKRSHEFNSCLGKYG